MRQRVKYGTAHPPPPALRSLAAGVTKDGVGAECREAALDFLSGVGVGWDKLDLVLWLEGPYARATRHAPRGARVVETAHARRAELGTTTIEELVTRVRGQVLAALEAAALDVARIDFAEEIQAGFVRKAMDEAGDICFVPVDASRMRLRDRVRSLFAADYLCRPFAYADLFVCHRCESVLFDVHAKESGVCRRHRLSGVVVRNDDVDVIDPKAAGTP